MKFVLLALPVLAIAASIYLGVKAAKNGGMRRGVLTHFVSLALIFTLAMALTAGVSAATADDETAAEPQATASETAGDAAESDGLANGLGMIAAALVTGLAGIGGGIAVAAGAPAAIGATAEDPKVFGKALIFVALGEAIALYGVVISVLILTHVQ